MHLDVSVLFRVPGWLEYSRGNILQRAQMPVAGLTAWAIALAELGPDVPSDALKSFLDTCRRSNKQIGQGRAHEGPGAPESQLLQHTCSRSLTTNDAACSKMRHRGHRQGHLPVVISGAACCCL